ncbi:MAG: HAD-IA family hydrolase, partial [Gammaproteobacteria bacterium]
LTQLAQTYSQTWLAATAAAPISLFADAETTLMQLSESGYLLAVATGKSRRGLDRALRAAGLERVFSGLRTADETASKPHPAMLEELLQEFELPASAALMIGDSEYDVQMAMAAGVDAVGVASGVHSPGRLLECGALACLDSITGLPVWLGSLGTSKRYYANSH